MTAYTVQSWTVRRHWLQAKTNANEGCNSCASLAGLVLCSIAAACYIAAIILSFKFNCKFYCMFYFTCDRSFTRLTERRLSDSAEFTTETEH